jgi:hypothetical protein
MKIASFDIGIKNMAYCIFETTSLTTSWEIIDWDVLDLITQEPSTTSQYVCGCALSEKTKKSKNTLEKTCGKKAKYYTSLPKANEFLPKANEFLPTADTSLPKEAEANTYVAFCEKHAKTQTEYLIPSKEYTLTYLRKQSVGQIQELYKSLGISGLATTSFPNKPEMIDAINQHYTSRLFSEIRKSKSNANDANLIHIGWAIRKLFDNCPHFQDIHKVVIENQISPIATRMKTIQGMLAQYFIMKSSLENPIEIVFVSSANKLRVLKNKDVNPPKVLPQSDVPENVRTLELRSNVRVRGILSEAVSEAVSKAVVEDLSSQVIVRTPKYKQNKKDGVALCNQYIGANPCLAKWSTKMTVSKKDDLADCFLQGVWFLSNRNIITCAENLKINIV